MQTVQVCIDWGQVKLSQIMQEKRIDWGQVKLSRAKREEVYWLRPSQAKSNHVMEQWSGVLGQISSYKRWRSVLIQAKSR